MRKIKRIVFILSVTGAILISAGVLTACLFPLTPLNDTVVSETYYFSDVNELIVISGTIPLDIGYTDGEICEVSYLGGLPLICENDEYGTLRLTQDDSFTLSLFSARRRDFHINVRLPRKSYRRVSLTAGSGSITSEPISCDSLELSTRSGDITVLNTDNRAKIRTESGRITLGLNSLGDDMDIAAGSGDIFLTVTQQLSFCLKFMTEKGSCTAPDFGERFVGRKGDAVIIQGDGQYLINITSDDGSLTLERG